MTIKSVAQAVALMLIGFFCLGAGTTKEHLLAGATMGTTYHIKIIAPRGADMETVQKRIDQHLDQLNRSMSVYRSESEISRFNKLKTTGQPFIVSSDFLKVMRAAETIHDMTAGAWDGTVYPLMRLWGFGSSETLDAVPSHTVIEKTLERVGFKLLEVSDHGYLKKRNPHVTVDLGSIAKGYGVDVIARLIQKLGYTDYLVEIGGEVYAAGRRRDGSSWKVGVNRPAKSASPTDVYKSFNLENRAMATSGDYRNFVKIGGHAYSHIIDPRTGYPVDNGVVSASVIAPNCTWADGLATALMIMGPSEGVALLNRLEKVEGLIVVRRRDGSLADHWSKGILRGKRPSS
jgi:thiamine biosynthesis lipoprotein